MEIPKVYNPHEAEDRWYPIWESRGYFQPEANPGGKPYTIVIPPPNVTGNLHIGHALNHTLQDILVRWRRMQGYKTLWLPGTDHAGIATQVVVERQLAKEGLTREQIGREEFERRVWQWRAESGGTIQRQMRREGISVDWSREAFTLDELRSQAVREAFVRLYEEGLIYRGDYIINWCPRCQTALSDLEAPKKEVRGKLYYVAYKIKNVVSRQSLVVSEKLTANDQRPATNDVVAVSNDQRPTTNDAVVIATTRPETMLGDTAVAVNPNDERYRHLIGQTVVLPLVNRGLKVISDDRVEMDFGTGVVKITPGHDPVDYEIGKAHSLPMVVAIDKQGRMTEDAGPFAGLDRFEARRRVLKELEKIGQLVKIEDYTHSVGHCQRCETVIEPLVSTQWFLNVKPLAAEAIQAVKDGRTQILPENWTKTYFEWLENIRDWCISRQLWWGHRIPAWYCPDHHITVGRTAPSACSVCAKKELRQEEDVLDTWFSSALWPFSTLGWPEDTEDLRTFYPTSLLVTAFDILFFWVARMMMMGVKFIKDHPSRREALNPECVPFHAVLIHGLVRDPYGQKMSKTRGNVIDPLDIFQQYGTDAVRYTLVAAAAPGNDIALQYSKMETYRNFCNKIWNAARFVLMNCPSEIEQERRSQGAEGAKSLERRAESLEQRAWSAEQRASTLRSPLPAELPLVDRWLTSVLNRTIAKVNRDLEEFRLHEAAVTLYHFFWHDFCDWYIELGKAAVTAKEDTAERQAARERLVSALETALRLLHPFMPFITEEIWQRLPHRGETICLAPYPVADESNIDAAAERQAETVIELITKVRNIRAVMEIDQARTVDLLLHPMSEDSRLLISAHSDQIKRLARVGKIEFVRSLEGLQHVARDVVSDLEMAVPLEGLIDFEKEKERLKKNVEKIEKELDQLERRLSNPDFVQRATPEVVAETHQRCEELVAKRNKLSLIAQGL